jgi:hypothetical protein
MPDKVLTRERYGEAFWRKHHEAWQQSTLNQREANSSGVRNSARRRGTNPNRVGLTR